jgi:iron complex transport system substrate-binding protein
MDNLWFDTDLRQIYHPRSMGQRIGTFIFLLSLCSLAHAANPSKPTTRPLVASLVPAATDLIVSMGARGHLVGMSNYDDAARPELKHLPKIGDYESIDWERLRSLKPQILIIFQSPDRISPGVKERAAKLNIKLVNIRTETLSDIFTELKKLGDILNEQEKAAAAAKKLDTQLQTMRQRLRNLPPVKTLLLRDETTTATVGRGNFLNDLLELAGGQNVIEDTGWPTIDRERLASLNPDAIIILLSNVPPQVEKQAAATIARMTNLTAVKNKRVKIINVWYAQQPGLHLGELADQFADFLHPQKGASNSDTEINRRDAETQRNAAIDFFSLRASMSLQLLPICHQYKARPATWIVWLGCDDRAPEGQLVPSRASPFHPFHSPHPFLSAFDSTASSKSPQVTLIKTDFRGLQGGRTRPPCVCAVIEERRATSRIPPLPAPSTTSISKTSPTPSPSNLF